MICVLTSRTLHSLVAFVLARNLKAACTGVKHSSITGVHCLGNRFSVQFGCCQHATSDKKMNFTVFVDRLLDVINEFGRSSGLSIMILEVLDFSQLKFKSS